MVLMQMPSGAMVMTHESFTHPFAGSGLELHGTKGSVFARDVMTQQPVGEVELVTKAGAKTVTFDATNLYVTALREFYAAVAGQGGPRRTDLMEEVTGRRSGGAAIRRDRDAPDRQLRRF